MTTIQYHHLIVGTIVSFFALNLTGYLYAHSGQANNIVENCENGVDDDGDGMIDLNDPDCVCDIVEPISLIPNPSFEDMDCCPSSQSQMGCASVWIQASEATTDFIHMCDWMGWPEFPPPLPFPDGEGIMGFRDGRVRQEFVAETNWKEYAGACLLSPLIKDTAYIFEFYVGFVNRFKSPDINISFFGTSDCDNLPFGIGNDAFGCPTNGPGWVRLGSSFVSGGAGNKWVKTSITVTPDENITAIAIGPDCPPVHSSISIYYFFDNLTLVDLRSFQFQISEQSHPCAEDFTLKIPEQPGFTYQWYKEGIALVGETSAHLLGMHGEGNYQVRIKQGGSCSVTGIYRYSLPVVTANAVQTICKEDVYEFGNRILSEPGQYVDTFKNIFNCDSVVFLDLKVSGVLLDTVDAKIFDGETYNIDNNRFSRGGDYLVHLTSSQGCDSLVQLHLDYYNVFFPNVFSPNGDGINDLFGVVGRGDEIESSDFIIFDKWGNQIFHGPQWDGKLDGGFISPGVYTYSVRLRMNDEVERLFQGSVTIIR